ASDGESGSRHAWLWLPRVGRGSVVKAAQQSSEPYPWLGMVPLTPGESGQYCSHHPRPSSPPARPGTSARACFRAVLWPRFTPFPASLSPVSHKTLHERALSCTGLETV